MNAEQRHQKATKRVSRTAVLFFSLIVISAAIAQLPTATVLGVVKDSSGAVMPKANLTARNVETGQTRTTVASGDGSYRFAALPVGSYEIRVENPGFESAIRMGLTLTVGQEAVVDFTLQVGAVEQTVAVTAEAPMVNTTSGSLGGLVGEQTVADLPLNGRNYADLTLLQPGITQYRSFSLGTTVTGTLFSSNGAPIAANNYLLDGAIMQAWHGLTTASFSNSTLGVEGIREWRMVTNAFSAEYGLTMGSQIMIVSKSGTNTFHGSAFEYLRNSALDARNFFDYQTIASSGRLPPFKRNNFGGSFGGPIKKNKTFLFGVYEVVRQRLGLTTISNTIPVSYKVDGGLVPQIAPTIKPLLALYPNPNLPNNQLTFPFTQPSNEQYGQMRVDQNFSTNDSMFARYTIYHDELTSPLAFPQFSQTSVSRYQYGTLSENHVFSPSLLNTARFSYSRSKTSLVSPSGITGPQYSFVPGLEIGTINIGAVSLFGPAGTAPNAKLQNIRQWSDDLFYTRGRHSLKFGGSFNRWQTFSLNGTNKLGQATFPSITSFLLAQPSTFTAITPGAILDRLYGYNTFASYLQDDLRVRSNLTLNLGLRY